MSQIKHRMRGPKSLANNPYARKYLERVAINIEKGERAQERREAQEQAEADNITLPKLRFMEGHENPRYQYAYMKE